MFRFRSATLIIIVLVGSLRATTLWGQDSGGDVLVRVLSFDCAATPRLPIAELVCGTPSLGQADFALAQVYYVLRQQVGQAGRKTLREEYLRFFQVASKTCAVPSTGALPSEAESMVACLRTEYERRRSLWLSHLTGSAAEEAQRPIGAHIALQRRLQQLGYLPDTAAIDGVYGDATRTAIETWQRSRNLPATGFLSDADAELLKNESRQTSVDSAALVAADRQAAKLADAALGGDESALTHLTDAAAAKTPSAEYGLASYYMRKIRQWNSAPGSYFEDLIDNYLIKIDPQFAETLRQTRDPSLHLGVPHDAEIRGLAHMIITLWQDAAARGDPASQAEIGNEYWGEATRKLGMAAAMFGPDFRWWLTPATDDQGANAALFAAIQWACGQAVHWLNLSNIQAWPAAPMDLSIIYSKHRSDASTEAGCFRPDPVRSDSLMEKAARLNDPDAIWVIAGKLQREGEFSEAQGWVARLQELAASGDKEAAGLLQIPSP